ncbi:hypothetical protein V9T40_004289 [Parthenolecanium corni]|uniref:Uncharacterized protein n=1 Tax=Parthenolecanium corni TaxID=536013 RepID=A0AAN9TTR1_9HEMI
MTGSRLVEMPELDGMQNVSRWNRVALKCNMRGIILRNRCTRSAPEETVSRTNSGSPQTHHKKLAILYRDDPKIYRVREWKYGAVGGIARVFL